MWRGTSPLTSAANVGLVPDNPQSVGAEKASWQEGDPLGGGGWFEPNDTVRSIRTGSATGSVTQPGFPEDPQEMTTETGEWRPEGEPHQPRIPVPCWHQAEL